MSDNKNPIAANPDEATEDPGHFGAMQRRVRYNTDIVAPDKSEWNENG